jgi:hypothetical protein
VRLLTNASALQIPLLGNCSSDSYFTITIAAKNLKLILTLNLGAAWRRRERIHSESTRTSQTAVPCVVCGCHIASARSEARIRQKNAIKRPYTSICHHYASRGFLQAFGLVSEADEIAMPKSGA